MGMEDVTNSHCDCNDRFGASYNMAQLQLRGSYNQTVLVADTIPRFKKPFFQVYRCIPSSITNVLTHTPIRCLLQLDVIPYIHWNS